MTNNTPNMNEIRMEEPGDAALDAQLAVLARMDGLAMPDGLEETLVQASMAAAIAANAGSTGPKLRIAGQARVHDAGRVRAPRWHGLATKLAAGLVLVAGLAVIARREAGESRSTLNGSSVAASDSSGLSGGAAMAANSGTDTSDWAIVTAVLGDTPASDLRELWSDTASLDERIKTASSSSELLTSEGSL